AAMAHAQWRGGGSQATLTPDGREAESWPIDLGQSVDLRTHGVTGRVYIDLETSDGWIQLGFGGLEPEITDLRLSYLRHPIGLMTSVGIPSRPKPLTPPPLAAQSTGGVIVEPTSDDRGFELKRMNLVTWIDSEDRPINVGLRGLILETVRHAGGTEFELSGLARR